MEQSGGGKSSSWVRTDTLRRASVPANDDTHPWRHRIFRPDVDLENAGSEPAGLPLVVLGLGRTSTSPPSTSCCRTSCCRTSCCRTSCCRTTMNPTSCCLTSCCPTTRSLTSCCPTTRSPTSYCRTSYCPTSCCRSTSRRTMSSPAASRMAIASASNGLPKMSLLALEDHAVAGEVIRSAGRLERPAAHWLV